MLGGSEVISERGREGGGGREGGRKGDSTLCLLHNSGGHCALLANCGLKFYVHCNAETTSILTYIQSTIYNSNWRNWSSLTNTCTAVYTSCVGCKAT